MSYSTRRGDVRKEPKEASMASGVVIAILSGISLLGVIFLPFGGFTLGDVPDAYFLIDLVIAFNAIDYWFVAIAAVTGSMICGMAIFISKLLKKLEVIGHIRSKWITFIAHKSLAIPATAMVVFGSLFLGVFLALLMYGYSANALLIPIYPVPYFLSLLGIMFLLKSFKGSKREIRAIKYYINKEKMKKKIPIKKKKIKREEEVQ